MRHVQKAFIEMGEPDFIEIQNISDEHGVAPIVSFTIQSDPIGEVGVNGVQAVDLLLYCKHLFKSLNDAFPCREKRSIAIVILCYYL